MSEALEQVLTELHAEARVLEKYGDTRVAKIIDDTVKRVRRAAEDFLTWLPEQDAILRSAHAQRWFRARFSQWEREGHAKRQAGRYYYRMCVVPQRANVSAAYADGRAAGREAARRSHE